MGRINESFERGEDWVCWVARWYGEEYIVGVLKRKKMITVDCIIHVGGDFGVWLFYSHVPRQALSRYFRNQGRERYADTT